MRPSVEITAATNERLEELQAEIRREAGQRISKQQLLEQIVRDAYESKDDVVELFRDDS